MTFLSLLAASAAALQPVPPPIISTPTSRAPAPQIARFEAGTVRCAGVDQHPAFRDDPFPAGVMYLPPDQSPAFVFGFRISAAGQPLSIRLKDARPNHGLDRRDLAPALAAWRFPPGVERPDCEVEFRARVEAVESADTGILYRYVALSRPSLPGYVASVARAAFERVRPAGSTCFDPRPTVRQRNFPPFEEIPQEPGTVAHAFVTHDIDAAGRPVNARVVHSSGNARLDRESLAATRASRFAPQARRGCLYYYYRTGDGEIRPPYRVPLERFRPENATCPVNEQRRWQYLPPLVFPAEFRARKIEGWAVIQFDLAPWGVVGNARVVAAEPAEAFGEQARQIISQARAVPSETGSLGCVERVVFLLPDDNSVPEAD